MLKPRHCALQTLRVPWRRQAAAGRLELATNPPFQLCRQGRDRLCGAASSTWHDLSPSDSQSVAAASQPPRQPAGSQAASSQPPSRQAASSVRRRSMLNASAVPSLMRPPAALYPHSYSTCSLISKYLLLVGTCTSRYRGTVPTCTCAVLSRDRSPSYS